MPAVALDLLGGELRECEGVVFMFEEKVLVGIEIMRLINATDLMERPPQEGDGGGVA